MIVDLSASGVGVFFFFGKVRNNFFIYLIEKSGILKISSNPAGTNPLTTLMYYQKPSTSSLFRIVFKKFKNTLKG
jgi:hypothetical protein